MSLYSIGTVWKFDKSEKFLSAQHQKLIQDTHPKEVQAALAHVVFLVLKRVLSRKNQSPAVKDGFAHPWFCRLTPATIGSFTSATQTLHSLKTLLFAVQIRECQLLQGPVTYCHLHILRKMTRKFHCCSRGKN